MLNTSARTSPFTRPAVKVFAIVASRFTYAGPSRTPLRAELPKVLGAGDENTDVSNQSAPGPTAPRTAGVPLTSGRCVLPGGSGRGRSGRALDRPRPEPPGNTQRP